MKVFDGLHAFLWRIPTQNNCNAYLIDGEVKILVDPGHRHLFGHVLKNLALLDIYLDQIDVAVVTHGHPDHLEAVTQLHASTMFTMSGEEYRNIKKFAGPGMPEPDFFLEEGDVTIGKHRFQVVMTPGHSPGSLCLYWPDKKALFTGVVVFFQGIGRTDLPGGNGKELKNSIQKISQLDTEYLFTGHGEILIGQEAIKANFKKIQAYYFNYL
jgi:glyoxylase-like metal-dependent hydrolase (beta-lactamase superfamily II)